MEGADRRGEHWPTLDCEQKFGPYRILPILATQEYAGIRAISETGNREGLSDQTENGRIEAAKLLVQFGRSGSSTLCQPNTLQIKDFAR